MRTYLLLLLWFIQPTPAAAHAVQHQVQRGEAWLVQLTHEDGTPFAHADCEVRRAGEDRPVWTGRTDVAGRLAFLPDGAGPWVCRAWSADGHGTQFTFDAPDPSSTAGHRPDFGPARLGAPLAAVGMILLLFAGLRVWSARKPA